MKKTSILFIIIFLILLLPKSIFSVTIKGNNPTLKELSVNIGELNPNFDFTITEYNIAVSEDVKKIEVTAIPEDGRATVKVSGNDSLKLGLNKIDIEVIAENGTDKKNYIINVTKGDVSKTNANIKNIKVTGGKLIPKFDKNTMEYVLERDNSTKKLDITAEPEDENANISIIEDADIKNITYVKCTASDGITTKKYILTIIGEEQIEDNNSNTTNITSNEENVYTEVNTTVENNGNYNTNITKVFGIILVILVFIIVLLIFMPIGKGKNEK